MLSKIIYGTMRIMRKKQSSADLRLKKADWLDIILTSIIKSDRIILGALILQEDTEPGITIERGIPLCYFRKREPMITLNL